MDGAIPYDSFGQIIVCYSNRNLNVTRNLAMYYLHLRKTRGVLFDIKSELIVTRDRYNLFYPNLNYDKYHKCLCRILKVPCI